MATAILCNGKSSAFTSKAMPSRQQTVKYSARSTGAQVRKARVVVLCACAVGMQRSFVWLVLVVLLTTAQAPYKGSTHSLLESVVTSRSLMFRSLHRWIEIVDRFLLLCRPPSPTPTE